MQKEILNIESGRYPMTPLEVFNEVGGGITMPTDAYLPDGYAWVEPTSQPEVPTGHRAIKLAPELDAGTWRQAWGLVALTEDEMRAQLAEAKAMMVKLVTAKRWDIETGGIELPGGVRVGTDKDDQNRITTVIANAGLAGVTSVDFKTESGWVTLTIEQIQQIAAAVALHVQACFSNERAHHEAIEAIQSLEELQGYDYYTGWPV